MCELEEQQLQIMFEHMSESDKKKFIDNFFKETEFMKALQQKRTIEGRGQTRLPIQLGK
jgi:hypothetical protein